MSGHGSLFASHDHLRRFLIALGLVLGFSSVAATWTAVIWLLPRSWDIAFALGSVFVFFFWIVTSPTVEDDPL